MSYKTILVHVDESPQSAHRSRVAALISRNFEAHLIGVAATGLPAQYMAYGAFAEVALHLSEVLAQQRRASLSDLSAFDQLATSHDVHSCETRLVETDTGSALCEQALYADLLVMSQAEHLGLKKFDRMDTVPYVLAHCGRPVLLLPRDATTDVIGKRIVIAWDASPSAARAVHNALPLLRRAGIVEVLCVQEPTVEGPHSSHPGNDLGRYLARHGVSVVVSEDAPSHRGNLGEQLLAHAEKSRADLLVMGCYGRARIMEYVLGGTTKHILTHMSLPVLMSH